MFRSLSPWINATVFVAAALVVWVAGARLARHADRIAEKTDLGRELLGILLLGGITSLPELAVGVSATLAGAPELSVNDVLGSAAINVVILAAADAVYGRQALTSTPATPEVMLQGTLGIVLLAVVVGASIAGDVAAGTASPAQRQPTCHLALCATFGRGLPGSRTGGSSSAAGGSSTSGGGRSGAVGGGIGCCGAGSGTGGGEHAKGLPANFIAGRQQEHTDIVSVGAAWQREEAPVFRKVT